MCCGVGRRMRMSLSHMHGSSCAEPASWSPHGLCGSTQGRGGSAPGSCRPRAAGRRLRFSRLRTFSASFACLSLRLCVWLYARQSTLRGGALVLLRSLCTTMNYSWLLHSIAEIMDILPWDDCLPVVTAACCLKARACRCFLLQGCFMCPDKCRGGCLWRAGQTQE